MKRRYLSPGQKVVIIYDNKIGFVRDEAKFIRYDTIIIGEVKHQIPIFEHKDQKITGMDCFWALPHEVQDDEDLHRLQYNLLSLQVKALEIGLEKGYEVPQKIKDPEIKKMAEANRERTNSIIQKFGYDPRDESWLERDMSSTTRERNWFAFERENPTIFLYEWDKIVEIYSKKYNDKITVEDAKNLSKKRTRYLLGSHNIRMSGEHNVQKWIKEAYGYEKKHRERENRMITWSLNRKGKYPRVRVKKPINFEPDCFFNQCVEKIPYVFTSANCKWIKSGVELRVISYDPELKYIKLDFIEEMRNQIREQSDRPWEKDGPDYDFLLKPEEIETHLELLENLV